MILRCGGGEIRTHDTCKDVTVFKTVALDRSATPPDLNLITPNLLNRFLNGVLSCDEENINDLENPHSIR